MKILQINSVYKYGSTGKIVESIHKTCINKGLESFVIFSRDGAIGKKKLSFEGEKNIFKISRSFEEKVHLVKGVFFDKHGLYSKKNTQDIIKKISEINPDLIHIHNLHGFYINYKILFEYLKKINKPIVYTIHDCWAFTGYCSHFDFNGCDMWKKGCKTCKFKNVYPYRILSNSKNNFQTKEEAFNIDNLWIVTPSRWLKNRVEESFLKTKNIRLINNSLDLSKFEYKEDPNFKKEHKLESKIVILGLASLFTKQKGFDEYIKLAKRLDDKYRLVLIGLNHKQISSLPKNVMGLERIEDFNTLIKWYSNSDIFLNLTLEDTYPSVNIEAMACGLPIISYRTGGSSEMVEGRGLLVDKYDIDGLIRALETISLEKKFYRPKNDMAITYLDLYKKIVGENDA